MTKVLVCGDAMVDRYWFGDVARISPEAPVPVLAVHRQEERRGGAANVAENLVAMGARIAELYSPSFKHDPVIKLRLIARNQQLARVDFDVPQKALDPAIFPEAAAGCGIVVLSDYGKGTLANIAAIIWRLKQAGKRVLVDPKGRRFSAYEGADVLKPNLSELREMIGGWSCEDDLEHKVKAMQRAAKIPAVLLTRGQAGMTLYNGAVHQIPCEAREVFDVSGAGDTALAAFAASVARGMSYSSAAVHANRAAAVAVGRFGTAVVTQGEVFG